MIEEDKYISLLRKIKSGIYGNLLVKQSFVDCCREFQFIRVFDTINFNNKMNSLGITHLVLDDDYNFTEILESDIIEPILNHSNNVFGIIGNTGTGKSELGQTIALISKKANKKYLGRDVEIHLCYTWEDFHTKLKILEKGDIILKDEMPKTIGKGSRTQKWAIENVLHSIRLMENTFIFIDPMDINVDLCNLYLESAGMNFKIRANRFMLLNKNREYFGHVYMKLHNDEQLRYWYETQKDKFIRNIKEKAGKIIIEEDDNGEIDDDKELKEKLREEKLTELEIIYCIEWKNSIKKPSEVKLAEKYYGNKGKRGTVRNRIKVFKKIVNEIENEKNNKI